MRRRSDRKKTGKAKIVFQPFQGNRPVAPSRSTPSSALTPTHRTPPSIPKFQLLLRGRRCCQEELGGFKRKLETPYLLYHLVDPSKFDKDYKTSPEGHKGRQIFRRIGEYEMRVKRCIGFWITTAPRRLMIQKILDLARRESQEIRKG